MAQQVPFPLPGATRARRLGFGVFCAAAVALIVLLGAVSPLRGPGGSTVSAGQEQGPGPGSASSRAPGEGVGPNAGPVITTPPGSHAPGAGAAPFASLIAAGQPIFCGAGTRRLVALTFDDGPGPDTQATLDLLEAKGMTATFFTVGKLYRESRFTGLLRQEAGLGAVGDHTWDHIPVTGMTQAQLDDQIQRTRLAEARRTGRSVFLFRAPLGLRDGALDAYLRSHGMLEVLWSVDSEDSQGAGPNQIYRTVASGLFPGAIILLHENRGTTQLALPRILDLIRERGYRTVTVPQLLRMDPPSAHQLAAHSCR
jgi:peptidoglycan/xylan/chitin deacetylase (PgdA/CDA1 family)